MAMMVKYSAKTHLPAQQLVPELAQASTGFYSDDSFDQEDICKNVTFADMI
jgi:hypothetical protein